MNETPETGCQGDKTDNKEKSTSQTNAGSGLLPTPASKSQTKDGKKTIEYGKYILWPFKALGRLFQFLDKNDGAVTAIATIAIAILTWKYVTYSRGQLEIIGGQLKEMQDANRPYVLTNALFSFEKIPKPEEIKEITEIPITVRINNVGVSPAVKEMHSEPLVGLDTDSNVVEHLRTCKVQYPEVTANGIVPSNQFIKDVGLAASAHRHLAKDVQKDVMVTQTKHIIVFGGVKYSGIRGGDYETVYCYLWDVNSLTKNVYPWHICPCNSVK